MSHYQQQSAMKRIAHKQGWSIIDVAEDGARYENVKLGLRVIRTEQIELDGDNWVHVSVSRYDQKMPSWDDLMFVKDAFVGEDKEAYQVLPPKIRHINIHPGVLHLWCRTRGPVLPDFTHGGNSI